MIGDIVTVSHGLTINLGDYQSLRPSVSIQRTLTTGEASEVEDLRVQALDLLRLAVCDEARGMSKIGHLLSEEAGLIAFSKALGEATLRIYRPEKGSPPKKKIARNRHLHADRDTNCDEEDAEVHSEPAGEEHGDR